MIHIILRLRLQTLDLVATYPLSATVKENHLASSCFHTSLDRTCLEGSWFCVTRSHGALNQGDHGRGGASVCWRGRRIGLTSVSRVGCSAVSPTWVLLLWRYGGYKRIIIIRLMMLLVAVCQDNVVGGAHCTLGSRWDHKTAKVLLIGHDLTVSLAAHA